jgi:hypothetical protein
MLRIVFPLGCDWDKNSYGERNMNSGITLLQGVLLCHLVWWTMHGDQADSSVVPLVLARQ